MKNFLDYLKAVREGASYEEQEAPEQDVQDLLVSPDVTALNTPERVQADSIQRLGEQSSYTPGDTSPMRKPTKRKVGRKSLYSLPHKP